MKNSFELFFLDFVLDVLKIQFEILVVDEQVNGLVAVGFSFDLDQLVIYEFGQLSSQSELVAHEKSLSTLVI